MIDIIRLNDYNFKKYKMKGWFFVKKIVTLLLSVILIFGVVCMPSSAVSPSLATFSSVKFDNANVTIDVAKISEAMVKSMDAQLTYMMDAFFPDGETMEEYGVSLDSPIDAAFIAEMETAYPGMSTGLVVGDTYRDVIRKLVLAMFVSMDQITADDAAKINNNDKFLAFMAYTQQYPYAEFTSYEYGDTLVKLFEGYLRDYAIPTNAFNKDFFDYYVPVNSLAGGLKVTEITLLEDILAELGDDYTFWAELYYGYNTSVEPAFRSDDFKVGQALPIQEGINILQLSVSGQDYPYTFVLDVKKSSEKQILTYKSGSVNGSIDQAKREITLVFPHGTDLKAIKPDITVSPYATVSPASGAAVDLSKKVTYTVTAEDGSQVTYTVTATTAPMTSPLTGDTSVLAFSMILLLSALGMAFCLKRFGVKES